MQVANGDKVKKKKKPAICYNIPFALTRAPNDKFSRFQKTFPNLESKALSLKTLVKFHELDHG